MPDSYEERYRQQMDTFRAGLWSRLDLVPTLEPDLRDVVAHYLLELACQAQNIANISLGRRALLGLPRVWLLAHVEVYAEPLLQLEDEWEYRRLAEVYEHLDQGLLRRLIARGLDSRNGEIREAARDFAAQLRAEGAS